MLAATILQNHQHDSCPLHWVESCSFKTQPLSVVVVLTAMRGATYVLQGHMRPHAAIHLQAEVHGAWD
jgi:hypothetical protein